jgi:uracil-DNA glycosylase
MNETNREGLPAQEVTCGVARRQASARNAKDHAFLHVNAFELITIGGLRGAVPHEFDPGYGSQPFQDLVRDYPGETVYPTKDFRTEWGPIFHRGRLDGTARVLVLGQDPAQHETIARRILGGEAGQRIQGFLAKLGIDRSYVMVNTFLYSVYGQGGGYRHRDDRAIAAYRNRWIDAIVSNNSIDAVVALGQLADGAWHSYLKTTTGSTFGGAYVHITHPTEPESSSKRDRSKYQAAIAAMLQNWNDALQLLKPAIKQPDRAVDLQLYGTEFSSGDDVEIPELDMPAGTPEWMRSLKSWAIRTGKDSAAKRATITVTIPTQFRPKD